MENQLCDIGYSKNLCCQKLKNSKNKVRCVILKTKQKSAKSDLTGEVFGKLTALKMTEKRDKSGGIMYKCMCECGNEKDISGKHLKNGNTKSCGCSWVPDLTGRTFGKLYAISRTKKRKGSNALWRCKCECGNEVEVATVNLKNGSVRSCGCLRTKDITGQKYGRLKVIAPIEKRQKGSGVIWKCECECGKEVEIPVKRLQKTKSCGCFRRENSLELLGGIKEMQITKQRQATMETEASPTNKSTGIRNIQYMRKNGFFTVLIRREGKVYRQNFRTLSEALHAKEQIFERYKRKEANWNEKL